MHIVHIHNTLHTHDLLAVQTEVQGLPIGVAASPISISRVEEWKFVKMQLWLFHSTAESVCGIQPPNENKPNHIM